MRTFVGLVATDLSLKPPIPREHPIGRFATYSLGILRVGFGSLFVHVSIAEQLAAPGPPRVVSNFFECLLADLVPTQLLVAGNDSFDFTSWSSNDEFDVQWYVVRQS